MLYRFKKRSEKDLLIAFQNGAEWAFSEIYVQYEKPIIRFITDRVGDPEVARDIAQETFLKVHRFRSSYQPDHPFPTWLWTIARNTITDWYRRQKPEDHQGEEFEVQSPHPNAEAILARKFDRRALRRLMKSLTSLQRRVIWFRVIHQLPYQEISKKMGLSLSAVKCLAYRSKRVLKDMGYVTAFA